MDPVENLIFGHCKILTDLRVQPFAFNSCEMSTSSLSSTPTENLTNNLASRDKYALLEIDLRAIWFVEQSQNFSLVLV